MKALLLTAALLFSTASHGYADGTLVAIAVTPSGDGVLRVPVDGTAAFAVAVMNVGPDSVSMMPFIRAVSVTGAASTETRLPVIMTVCQTSTETGACRSSEGLVIAPGQIKTYSVLVRANSGIGLHPPTNRIILEFKSYIALVPARIKATYTSTSVAVTTEP